MQTENQPTWIARTTGAKMLGLSQTAKALTFKKKGVRTRVEFKNGVKRGECCLEEIEKILREGEMRHIERRLNKTEGRVQAPLGEMPKDPITAHQASQRLDTCVARIRVLLNQGRLTLYRKTEYGDHFFSAAEVSLQKLRIEDWKMAHVKKREAAAYERRWDYKKTTNYVKKRNFAKRVGIAELNEFERAFSYQLSPREAAFQLNMTIDHIGEMRRQGIIKGSCEIPYWGGVKRYFYLMPEIKAIKNSESRFSRRVLWERTHRNRDWREETRKKLNGEKPAPFIHKRTEPKAKQSLKPRFERPEWMYSQCRDWTNYTYEVEARVRRTMKPQW